MTAAPYPADTRAKGWRFEIDYEKVDQSDTWSLAQEVPMAQPCLVMMWLMAWTQDPVGSFPNDENLIRAKCRIPPAIWSKVRSVLMRGWWLADDGRLYHPTITVRVLEMMEYRAAAAKRVAKHKEAKRLERIGNALPPRESTVKNDTGTGTGTGTLNKDHSETHTTGEGGETRGLGITPSTQAAVCVALKSVGIGDVNPGHLTLTELIDAGIGIDAFTAAGRIAVKAGKGFAYTLGIVKGQADEAATIAAKAVAKRPETARQKDDRERYERFTGRSIPPPDDDRDPRDTIDMPITGALQ